MRTDLGEFVCGRWLQASCLDCEALGNGARCPKGLPQVLKEAGLCSAREITEALRPLGLPKVDTLQVCLALGTHQPKHDVPQASYSCARC